MSVPKKSNEKVIQDCVKILRTETSEATQKWITDSKITSLTLRNVKALEIISLSNYMLQKMLINQMEKEYQLLYLLLEYNKKNHNKCYEYARLIKHFSQWDYEFEFIFHLALDERAQHLGNYLRLREIVLRSDFNRGKKELLSGVTTELQDWASMAKMIFKDREEEDVIDQFTTVVKSHYVQVKKSQSQKINGAEFLKICQIMQNSDVLAEQAPVFQVNRSKNGNKGQGQNIVSIFDETLLNGLSTQDKELIRVLSYKDKNIARMLEQKHTKMVHLIGEEVNKLRRDINREKERYIEVVEEKNSLLRLIERIKESSLKYIIDKHESNEFQLLQLLDNYNKKYNPKATDVVKTTDIINNRRLIEIIEREQLQND